MQSLFLLLVSVSAYSQNTSKSLPTLAEENDWKTQSYYFESGMWRGPHDLKNTSEIFGASAGINNLIPKDKSMGNWRFDIQLGYTTPVFAQVKGYAIVADQVKETKKSKFNQGRYLLLPVVSDFKIYQGQNQLKASAANPPTSFQLPWVGYGYYFSTINHEKNSSFRAATSVRYSHVYEGLASDQFSEREALVNGRESVNAIEADGWTFEANAQWVILNRVLLGIGGEKSFFQAKRKSGDQSSGKVITYYNSQLHPYARVKIIENGKVRVLLKGEAFIRKTNLNNYRSDMSLSFTNLGVVLGF